MMMPTSVVGTCRETAQNIGDYLDRKTPLFKRIRIGIHLTICARCRQWLHELKATFKGVDLARRYELTVEAPPELRAKIERIFQA